jgi:hypothetical protein
VEGEGACNHTKLNFLLEPVLLTHCHLIITRWWLGWEKNFCLFSSRVPVALRAVLYNSELSFCGGLKGAGYGRSFWV